MNDSQPNQENFLDQQLQRHGQIRAMCCPVCKSYYCRNYSQLCLHLLNPTNCFGNGVSLNRMMPPVDVHVAEANIVPVRLLMIFAWAVLWLVYQVARWTIVVPGRLIYQLVYKCILHWLFLYHCIIHRRLYQCIIQPISHLFYSTTTQLLYVITAQCLRIRLFLIDIYLGVIRPLVETDNFAVRWVCNFPDKCVMYAKHICLDVIFSIAANLIGVERAAAQAMFRNILGLFGWIIQKVESLNAIMLDFMFFPLDLPDGVPVWKRCVYYLFFAFHACALVVLCFLQFSRFSVTILSQIP